MQRQSLKNLSIISVILLVFVLPLMTLYHPEDVWCFTSRIYYGIQVFVIHLALAMWFFTLGASIGEFKNTDISNFAKNALISLSVIIYVGYNCFQYLIDNWGIYCDASECIGGYLSEMLVYRLPKLLYALIPLIIGILVSGRGGKLQENKLSSFGWMWPLLFMAGCCISEWFYFRDKIYAMIFSAVAIFPLTGTILLSYRLAAGNALNKYVEKHNKFFGFVAYLYPSAIFIYVFKIYCNPILVLFYLGVIWVIFKYVGKNKITYEMES